MQVKGKGSTLALGLRSDLSMEIELYSGDGVGTQTTTLTPIPEQLHQATASGHLSGRARHQEERL
jgi:hypothetical protein